MTPVILIDPDESRCRWLVDKDSAGIHIDKVSGERLIHYETSIMLDNLQPGEFRKLPFSMVDWNEFYDAPPTRDGRRLRLSLLLGAVSPMPCVMAPTKKGFKSLDFETAAPGIEVIRQGLTREAAAVMLRLAASYNNVSTDRVTESFKMGPGPRVEGVPIPWDKWKFITAWLWSDWRRQECDGKKLTVKMRWEAMQEMGYPHKIGAFDNMQRALFPKPTN